MLVSAHNFMIYNGATISSTSDFQTLWKNLAGEFASNSHVMFGGSRRIVHELVS